MEKVMRDATRVVLLLVVTGALLYWLDPVNAVIYQAVLIALFQVGATHLTRRILFPHLDLQSIAKKAAEEPTGAAVVFASIIVFLVAVMFLSSQVLK